MAISKCFTFMGTALLVLLFACHAYFYQAYFQEGDFQESNFAIFRKAGGSQPSVAWPMT